jgi:hypothetical protein
LVNLPEGAAFELPLYWAKIELRVEEEDAVLRWLGEKLDWRMETTPAAASRSSREREQPAPAASRTA